MPFEFGIDTVAVQCGLLHRRGQYRIQIFHLGSDPDRRRVERCGRPDVPGLGGAIGPDQQPMQIARIERQRPADGGIHGNRITQSLAGDRKRDERRGIGPPAPDDGLEMGSGATGVTGVEGSLPGRESSVPVDGGSLSSAP